MLVDSHCHLNDARLAEEGDPVFQRAQGAGVGAMLTISTKLEDIPAIRGIADAHSNVFCTVGVHPHEADQDRVTQQNLQELAQHRKVVGIGETGLDYHYMHSSADAQRRSFRVHAAAARALHLPLIVHTREAEADTITILREQAGKGELSGVLHCFSGSASLAQAALELGFYISFSGIITFKNAGDLRDIARDVPADRLLVETDAPYLAPVPHRGKRNEPAFVALTAHLLAELREVPIEDIAAQTTENFMRLFKKAADQFVIDV